MRFEEFEQRSAELWRQIPPEYRSGVDGVRVEREARAHSTLPDVYTLGECLTESYPSDWGGPDTVRSYVLLYYGSFWRLSREDEAFDWEDELWETLTHELQHHLESLATEDALEEMDYAADENFRRIEGESFDPHFFRAGESLGDDWWRVDDEYFRAYLDPGPALSFEWQGAPYRVAVPDDAADVLFLNVVEGVAEAPAALTLVVERSRGMLASLRALLGRQRARVEEYDVVAEHAGP
jgi:hypothetical protein